MQKPAPTIGMHHIALFVADLAACERFYTELMGMEVEWRPDENSVYLSSGSDNLALHRLDKTFDGPQRLDHLGFVLGCAEDVDAWFGWLKGHGVPIKTEPRTHRDGARSFYCLDPAGSTVQLIFHPPLAGNLG